jgi:HEAT repeat protein
MRRGAPLLLLLLSAASAQDPPPLSTIKARYPKAYAEQKTADRAALVGALEARLNERDAPELLAWIACNDPDEGVRLAAVRALKPKSRQKEIIEALADVVLSGHVPATAKLFDRSTRGGGALPVLRREVAGLWRPEPPPEVFAILGDALADKGPRKPKTAAPDLQIAPLRRALAAELLGDIGSAEAVKRLEAAQGDADAGVRRAVARALGYTYHPRARDALKKWEKTDDPILKEEVTAAAARLDRWEKLNPAKRNDDGTLVVPPPPDEPARLKDTEPSVELLFLVDTSASMQKLIPGVLRAARRETADLKKKTDKPIRAALMTMHAGPQGPEVALKIPFTRDVESVTAAIESLPLERGRPFALRQMRPLDAALRTAAYRLGWSRNSEKRLFAFTTDPMAPDPSLAHVAFTRTLAEDLKEHESGELTLHYTQKTAPTPDAMADVARAGAGRARFLDFSVPPQITVILRGARAADVKLIQEIFTLKARPKLVGRSALTFETTFKNEAGLDSDQLRQIEVVPKAGLDEILCVNPNLSAAQLMEFVLEITARGENNPAVANAYALALAQAYDVRGVAMVVIDYPTRVTPPEPNEPPDKLILFRASARFMARVETDANQVRALLAGAGFAVR